MLEVGKVAVEGDERRAAPARRRPQSRTWATEWRTSSNRSSAGSPRASIYASLALALVLIYRATDVVNFAQGEMATFTTYIAWSLMNHGVSYWPAFVLTLVFAFVRRRRDRAHA